VSEHRVLTIGAGELEATFVPEVGMLGTSLRFGGDELLDVSGGVARYEQGHQTGLPLLAPWANRLDGWVYEIDGVVVDLAGLEIGTDPNGLPIHGTMTAQRGWDVVASSASALRARFDYGARPDLLVAFPFAHEMTVDLAVDADAMHVATTVRPTGDRAVPVCFGWHPYLRLPGPARGEWRLVLPACEHLELDGRSLPTGASKAQPAEAEAVGDRTFDDLYALGDDRVLAIEGGGLRLAVAFEAGYPFAQVFAPPDAGFVCLEPMTAPTNALGTGTAPRVAPGDSFTARFSITVT
jgi:galactose mutarotase-like enzyme